MHREGCGDRIAVALGGEPGEIERAVEAILTAVWSADDWNVAIREPSLVSDEPLGPDQLAEWQAPLAKA